MAGSQAECTRFGLSALMTGTAVRCCSVPVWPSRRRYAWWKEVASAWNCCWRPGAGGQEVARPPLKGLFGCKYSLRFICVEVYCNGI
jgi:hypothetical protein